MMTNKNIVYVIFVFLIAFTSCKSGYLEREVGSSLKLAGSNKAELQKVLDYYSTNKSDSLKLKAAKFLIANMKYHSTAKGKVVDEFNKYIDEQFKIVSDVYLEEDYNGKFRDSAKYYNTKPILESDIVSISSNYLIQNIESSFAIWNKPYNTHLSFEQFAELILPYRLGNEAVEPWRSIYANRFAALLSDTIKTALQACSIINDSLIGYEIHTFESSIAPSDIRPSSLINIKFGLCNDYASLALYAMRSVGIPVAKDIIPRFGTRPNSHSFNMVLNNDGKTHDFSGSENQPNEHLVRFENIPKVYRQTFAPQASSLVYHSKNEEMPAQLASAFIKDVSGEYEVLKPSNIEVNFDYNESRVAYLGVFDVTGWYAVDWCIPSKGKALFKNVGADIVYCAGYYKNSKFNAVGYPFIVKGKGKIEYLKPTKSNKTSLKIERKYPIAINLSPIPNSIIGGKFQGANRADFSDARTLYEISEAPEFEYTTVAANNSNIYKYYRYLSSDSSRINMAEIEFYANDNKKLTGRVFGSPERSPYYPNSEPENAFDSNPLSFFYAANTNSFVGIELHKPAIVDKIRYIIRNGDNGIRAGQRYELLYADSGKWISAGTKQAEQDNYIIFNNIPSDALYWLRNLTKGKEERPFTISNNKQVWW